MFIFNTTFVVSNSKFTDWKLWLYGSYIPLMKNQVPASEVGTYEVMNAEAGEEKTISVQWKVGTPNDIETINRQSPIVLGQMNSEFGQSVLFFSSILKAI